MPRRKRGSKVLQKALQRMAALKSINPNFDFGNGVNAVTCQQAIDELVTSMDDYNLVLSLADEKESVFASKEAYVNSLTERMLIGVATQYGKDSVQYDQAGGTRTSERKKPGPRKKPAS